MSVFGIGPSVVLAAEAAVKAFSRFVVNDRRVVDLVTMANGIGDSQVYASLGVQRHGEIIAGVIFCDFNRHSVCLHVASKPGEVWLTRAFLRLVFGFAFDGLNVKRITGFVPESNAKAIRLDEHLGFKREAVLSDIYPDGGLIVYKMLRKDCRFV